MHIMKMLNLTLDEIQLLPDNKILFLIEDLNYFLAVQSVKDSKIVNKRKQLVEEARRRNLEIN